MRFIELNSFRNLIRIQSDYLSVLTTIRDYLNIKDGDGVIINFSANRHVYKETTNSVYDYNVDKWKNSTNRIVIRHHTLQFGFMLYIRYFTSNMDLNVIVQKLNEFIVDNNLLVIETVTTNQGFIGQKLENYSQYVVRVNRKSSKIYTHRIISLETLYM